jgi:hypothetical protein
VHNWPHLPGSLAGGEQVILNLVTNGGEGISVDKSEVGEENTHEDGAPEELIDGNLREDGNGISTGDFFVEPVVKVVSRGAVVDESEERESGKTLVINGSSGNEDLMIMTEGTSNGFDDEDKTLKTMTSALIGTLYLYLSHVQTHLSKQITKEPSNKRSKSLHGDGILVEGIGISLKPGDSSSPSNGRISEKRAQFGHVLLSEGRLVGDKGRLAESLGLRDDGSDAKGLCRKAGGDDYGTEELHGCFVCSQQEKCQMQMSASVGRLDVRFLI